MVKNLLQPTNKLPPIAEFARSFSEFQILFKSEKQIEGYYKFLKRDSKEILGT